MDFFFRAFRRLKNHFRTLELVSGALLIGVGLLVMTDQLARLNSYFTFMSRFVMETERLLQ
jgi:hypothetical protein